MSRFSGIYNEKIRNILSGKRSKIGTFLDAGWRGGAGVSKGVVLHAVNRDLNDCQWQSYHTIMPFRNVPLSRLLLVLFLAKQEKDITARYTKAMYDFCTKSRKYICIER